MKLDILCHPRGLAILFLTETWAHFSYYGMQALLVYYMIYQLGLSQPHASLIYGGYTAAVFITPLVGGWLADRFLGQTRAVLIGGSMMAAGHFLLSIEALFVPALATIALGNGLFLPSTTTQVGQLYAADDPRRPAAFGIYYAGINIGAFFAPIACGGVAAILGWHAGFVVAGVGMVLGLAIYVAGARYVRQASSDSLSKTRDLILRINLKELAPIIRLIAFVVFYRVAYQQSGNTIALFVERDTDRRIWPGVIDFTLPATWFQSINPMLVIALTPLLALIWRQSERASGLRQDLSRMSFGCGVTAVAFALLAFAAVGASHQNPTSWLWVFLFFILLSVGELFVIPIGIAVFNKLAPVQAASMVIGLWYFAKFAGNLLAGALGTGWEAVGPSWFFLGAAAAAAGGAAGFWLVREKLDGWSHRSQQ